VHSRRSAAAQTANSQSQMQVQTLLQAHPEAVDQLKGLLARRLRQEGSAIEEQSITDTMLEGRLQSDAAFRRDALRYLVDQGTLTEDQAKMFLGQAGESGDEISPTSGTSSEADATTPPERISGVASRDEIPGKRKAATSDLLPAPRDERSQATNRLTTQGSTRVRFSNRTPTRTCPRPRHSTPNFRMTPKA
jgi:hypothetical protein